MAGISRFRKTRSDILMDRPDLFCTLKNILLLVIASTLSACSLVAEVEQLLSQQRQEISLSGRPIANQTNQEELLITGRCVAGMSSFKILFPPPAQTVQCSNESWSTTIDVSASAEGMVQIITDHITRDGHTPVTFQIEKKVTPPSIDQFIINGGNLFTKNSATSYLVSGSGVQRVYVTEDSNCAAGGTWKASQGAVDLSLGEGEKTLYFKAQDSVGNSTACLSFSNTVTLDQTAPQVTGISDDLVGSSSKTWNWSCLDASAPCKYSYTISKDPQAVPSLSFSSVTTASQNSGSGVYYLSVLAQDNAGNISLVKRVQAVLAANAPQLVLENGSLYKNSSDVTLQLSSFGDFNQIEISNSAACATPTSLSVLASLSWQLQAGEGLKTIYYRFKNTSTGEVTSCEQKSITIDKTAPVVTELSTTSSSPVSGAFRVKAIFSEVVTGFNLSKIHVTNGTASLLAGTGAVYEFDITPAGPGVVSIKIPALSAFDLSGNGNAESTSLEMTMVVSKIATTLSSSAGAKTNVSPIPYTVVFADSVTGFGAASISVEGGTVGGITGSGANYSFSVTPSGEGVVKVQVLEDSVQAAGGAYNLASIQVSRTFDQTGPVITGLSNDPNWKKTANWSWGCSKVCTYRKITSTNPNDEPTGIFAGGSTASASGSYSVLYLHVQAKDEAGNLSPVYHYSVHLDNSSPMNPQSPSLGAVPQDLTKSPTMSWGEPTDNLSGVSHYDVEIYLSSNNSIVKSWTTLDRGTALTGLNLQAGVKYYFKVRAIDKAGNISSASGKSADWTALASACPTGFVLVPKLAGYTTADFCVAKYEMKDPSVSGVYVSKAAGIPVSGMTRAQAASACQSMGVKYSLIKNGQWQTIARNIESVASNWSFSQKLNQGYSSFAPGAVEASADDNSPCYQTSDTCTAADWKSQKRTHTLSNGSVIWDLGGNLAEWVLESLSDLGAGPVIDDNGMGFLDFPDLTPEHRPLFGPANSSLGTSAGLGLVLSGDGQAILRGGSMVDAGLNGVFAAILEVSPTFSSDNIGFRCVYEP